jgi:hypothetical protein
MSNVVVGRTNIKNSRAACERIAEAQVLLDHLESERFSTPAEAFAEARKLVDGKVEGLEK